MGLSHDAAPQGAQRGGTEGPSHHPGSAAPGSALGSLPSVALSSAQASLGDLMSYATLGLAAVRFSQGVLALTMALRIVSSLRMQAVSASFSSLPAEQSRQYSSLIAGLCRLATRALIYRLART